MKIIVTGASGFLGRYVTKTLVMQGHEVIALSRRSPGLEGKLTWVEMDLLDSSKLRPFFMSAKPEGLVHLAWQSEYANRWESVNNLQSCINTIKLLQEFADAGGRKAVLAGSCAEYDWQYGYCIEDQTPIRPWSVYGKCKDVTRQTAQDFCLKSGIQLAWARIFFAYGYGEHNQRLIPYVAGQLIRKQPVKCTHGNQFRDFIHAEDVALAMAHLLNNKSAEGTYNIATGLPLRIRDIVDFCASRIAPFGPIEFGVIPALENDPGVLIADVSKLKALGWGPTKSNFDHIAQYIDMLQLDQHSL
jgi:nucleoside-diphosphate-sugar epimerase